MRLVLDDGTIYPHPGRLLFTDATVDPTTGQVTLRGEFPNPKSELLPGMYVRVQIEQGIDSDALAVPQQAIQRNDAGESEVYVVTDDNRAIVQPVRTRPRRSTTTGWSRTASRRATASWSTASRSSSAGSHGPSGAVAARSQSGVPRAGASHALGGLSASAPDPLIETVEWRASSSTGRSSHG